MRGSQRRRQHLRLGVRVQLRRDGEGALLQLRLQGLGHKAAAQRRAVVLLRLQCRCVLAAAWGEAPQSPSSCPYPVRKASGQQHLEWHQYTQLCAVADVLSVPGMAHPAYLCGRSPIPDVLRNRCHKMPSVSPRPRPRPMPLPPRCSKPSPRPAPPGPCPLPKPRCWSAAASPAKLLQPMSLLL